jgi:ABC-2 type transport system ATP-binding protein
MLKEKLPDASVGLFGDRVHVVGNRAESIVAEIERLLAEGNIAVQKIRPIEPTLEDVFISVVAEKSKG